MEVIMYTKQQVEEILLKKNIPAQDYVRIVELWEDLLSVIETISRGEAQGQTDMLTYKLAKVEHHIAALLIERE